MQAEAIKLQNDRNHDNNDSIFIHDSTNANKVDEKACFEQMCQKHLKRLDRF